MRSAIFASIEPAAGRCPEPALEVVVLVARPLAHPGLHVEGLDVVGSEAKEPRLGHIGRPVLVPRILAVA
jgi:hypothetical protein